MNYKIFTIVAILLLVVSVSATTVTLIPPSTSSDAKISRSSVNENFSVIRDGVGTTIINASSGSQTLLGVATSSTSLNYSSLARYGWCNNTAFLPDDAVISSATFGVYGQTGAHSLGNMTAGLIGFNPTDPSLLTIDDYNKTVFTMYSDSNITQPNWDNAGWNTFTLNTAGKSAINKTGYTCVMLATTNDIMNTTKTGLSSGTITWLTSDYTIFKGYKMSQGSPYIPNITITYTSEIENTTTVYENTMDFYPSIDGYVFNQTEYPHADLSTIRGAASSTWGYPTQTYALNFLASGNESKIFRYGRPLIGFNTSGLPDTAVIISANLSLYAADASYQYTGVGTFNYTPTKWSPETNGSMSYYNDYNNFDDTPYSTFSGITANSRNNWTLNTAARANISKTGYTNYMIRPWWDVYNDSTNVSIVDWARTDFRFYTTEMGNPYMPVLTVNYNYTIPEGTYFTTNLTQTDNLPPTQNVSFNDTSVRSYSVNNRIWRYYDYGTLPELPCTGGVCVTGGNPKQWNNFSWTNESSPTHRWGSGNWSIELDVQDTTGEWHNSTPGYSWINISAGSTNGVRLPYDYEFFQADSIFRTKTNTMPLKTQSATWIAQMKTATNTRWAADDIPNYVTTFPSAAYPAHNLSYYRTQNQTQARYYVINDTISRQLFKNHNQTSGPYEWDFGAAAGGFPIPDDVRTMVGGTDHSVTFIDADNHIQYGCGNCFKRENGTWTSSPTIWNLSGYTYRFSANATSPYGDNGGTWLGNKWIYTGTDGAWGTPRREKVPTYGNSDAGIGFTALTLMYDEVANDHIHHPIWVTIHEIGGGGAWPSIGRSGAPSAHCPSEPGCSPTGSYMRLKESIYNNLSSRQITGAHATIIAKALYEYGAIQINDGSDNIMNLNMQVDSRWNVTDTDDLLHLTVDDFEFVNVTDLMVSRYSTQAKVSTPTASFTQNVTNGYAPLPVQFTDTSTGNATSWSWDFGDGNYSITRHPTHTFYGVANYTVTLEACNGALCSEVSHYVSTGTPSTIIAVIYHHLQQFFLLARLV